MLFCVIKSSKTLPFVDVHCHALKKLLMVLIMWSWGNELWGQVGHSTEPVTWQTVCLSTWRPPWGPMSFAPMAASSRIDRGYHNLSKTISFRPFFRVTILWNDPADRFVIVFISLGLPELFPFFVELSVLSDNCLPLLPNFSYYWIFFSSEVYTIPIKNSVEAPFKRIVFGNKIDPSHSRPRVEFDLIALKWLKERLGFGIVIFFIS